MSRSLLLVSYFLAFLAPGTDGAARGVDMDELAAQVTREREEKPALAKTFSAIEAASSYFRDAIELRDHELAEQDLRVWHSHDEEAEQLLALRPQSHVDAEREAAVEAAVAEDNHKQSVLDHRAALAAAQTGFQRPSPQVATTPKAKEAEHVGEHALPAATAPQALVTAAKDKLSHAPPAAPSLRAGGKRSSPALLAAPAVLPTRSSSKDHAAAAKSMPVLQGSKSKSASPPAAAAPKSFLRAAAAQSASSRFAGLEMPLSSRTTIAKERRTPAW
mmetsp:Transcript_7701/g.16930  ORF Transcript_7701/g.16930 Transcript_7701/m.16930 type:complete len:275 (+) Transcript_7701:123-947(+)